MSIFRPLNSDESNLFTIRCVISFIDTPYQIIAGGSKITINTNLLISPTENNLPEYFEYFLILINFMLHMVKNLLVLLVFH